MHTDGQKQEEFGVLNFKSRRLSLNGTRIFRYRYDSTPVGLQYDKYKCRAKTSALLRRIRIVIGTSIHFLRYEHVHRVIALPCIPYHRDAARRES
jgi:hypothetical protein